ncbi:MAG: hypothetical protein OYM47_12730 [Gemmatimonadota bacterium]|nr:hypothetical protein [Gemmatimonadota bacterium]
MQALLRISAVLLLTGIVYAKSQAIHAFPAAADSQFTGSVPLELPRVPLNASSRQLEQLFDEIIRKTEEREAFSEVKERNMSFSALEDMKRLRSEFVASKTEAELFYALVKLSNARRDNHLWLDYDDAVVDGVFVGRSVPEPPDGRAPIHVLPDLSDIHNPAFIVAAVHSRFTSPKPGDAIVGVNGRSIEEYIKEFTFWTRHSTLHGLNWKMAALFPFRLREVPLNLYSDRLDLTLERPSGMRYDVSLPYCERCGAWGLGGPDLSGFTEVMRLDSFNVLLDRNQGIILLQWLDFDNELIQDIIDLMEYAEQERLLDYDMIIDVSRSSGGSRGAYAILRLVDRPFRTTFGNVRLSDLGRERISWYVDSEPRTDAPDIFGLNWGIPCRMLP